MANNAKNKAILQAQKEIAKRKAAEEEAKKAKQAKKKKTRLAVIIVACITVVVLAVVLPLTLTSKQGYTSISLSTGLLDSSGEKATAALMALNDCKIETFGYAVPCSTYFYLSPSSEANCPFASSKYSNDAIPILYRDGKSISTNYSQQRVKVQGTLHIGDTVIYDNGVQQEKAYMVIYVDKISLT